MRIDTWNGWRFVVNVLDCHTKSVLRHAMDNKDGPPLISQALERAVADL